VTHFHSDLTAWDGIYADQRPLTYVPGVACFSLVPITPDHGPPVVNVHGSDSETETDTDFEASSDDDSDMYALEEENVLATPKIISGNRGNGTPSPVPPEYWPISP
jgi:hypothetical protein